MKITIKLLFATLCLSLFSCTNYEQLRIEGIQTAREALPGLWRVTSVEINPDGSYYTNQAGVTEAMTLEDFGTVEFSQFSDEDDTAIISYKHQGEQFNSYITDIHFWSNEETWIYLRSDDGEPSWESEFGQFINNLFFLNENYHLIIVDENRLELIEETRSINRIVLER